jgi:chromosome segregation ATPase
LRRERQDLQQQCAAEQQAGAKSRQRVQELEKHLRESATCFAGAKMELEKRATERAQMESELRAELEAAKIAAQRAESACHEESARAARLREEMAELQQARDEISARLKSGEQSGAEQRQKVEELENRLRETASELGRTKGAMENLQAERARLQAEQGNTPAVAAELGQEMCRLRENEAAHLAELAELERRVRDSVVSLARATADLDKERGERRRIEQRSATLTSHLHELHEGLKQHLDSEGAAQARVGELELQLREREETIARVSGELHKEAADRQLAEDHLRAVGDMSAELRKHLSLFEESKKVFHRAQEELESRLASTQRSLNETTEKLQSESGEKMRLEQTLQATRRDLNDASQKTAGEVSRMQSELQVEQLERKRLESDAIQARFSSLESTRVGRAMVNSFRRQMRAPVERLTESSRRLLESGLEEESKQLVESMLENALLLQSSLQENSATPTTDRAEGDTSTAVAAAAAAAAAPVRPVTSPTQAAGPKRQA